MFDITLSAVTCSLWLLRYFSVNLLNVYNNVWTLCSFLWPTGQFLIQNVSPQPSGESAKVKVKVRVNVHGVFSVSGASLVEIIKTPEGEEPMETEQTVKEDEVCSLCIFSRYIRLMIYNVYVYVWEWEERELSASLFALVYLRDPIYTMCLVWPHFKSSLKVITSLWNLSIAINKLKTASGVWIYPFLINLCNTVSFFITIRAAETTVVIYRASGKSDNRQGRQTHGFVFACFCRCMLSSRC